MGKRKRRSSASYLKKRSTTDPDATLHYRPGLGVLLSYKAHFCASSSGIITAVAVSSSAEHDTSRVAPLMQAHERVLSVAPASVTADQAYGTEEALGYLQSRGITTYISPMGTRNQPRYFKKELFKYDPSNDIYICPGGRILRRKAKNYQTNYVHYRSNKTSVRPVFT